MTAAAGGGKVRPRTPPVAITRLFSTPGREPPMRIAGDALSGLIAWTRRPPWREEFDAVLGEHLRDACEAVGVGTFDELRALVGDHGFQNLWGCALEDLFTRRPRPAISSTTI